MGGGIIKFSDEIYVGVDFFFLDDFPKYYSPLVINK